MISLFAAGADANYAELMSGSAPDPARAEVARRLRASKGAIIDDFVVRTRAGLEAARALDRDGLIDSLPDLLDQLAQAWDDGGDLESLNALAGKHGKTRAQQAYGFVDLVAEYHVLKRVIKAALRRETPLPRELEDAVSEQLDETLGASSAEFALQQSQTAFIAATRAEARHKLEAIFAASPAAMALWRGPDMAFELVNPAYQALFPGRELIGRPFLEALPEFIDQPFSEYFARVLETGEPFVGVEVLARHRSTADGPMEDHYYDFSYVRIDDVHGEPYGVYDHAVDVTARVLARRALEQSQEELRHAIGELMREREARERLVALISHDLRTPLSAARMTAFLVARRAGDEDAVRSGATRIADNLDRADAMIRDLLDASRISAGQDLPLELETVDLHKLTADTLTELSTVHGNRFVLRGDERVDGVWSKSGLRRVIENLCNNAVKYGSAEVPVTVTLCREDDRVELAIHNGGPPIPAGELGHLFEPFRRSDSARLGGHRGWGLGLTLVKGLVDAHGGSVSVESTSEQGTTFRVTLPLDARHPARKAAR